MKILRISFFDSDPWGNGGERRTAQITELLNKANISEQHIKFWDFYKEVFNQRKFSKVKVLKIGYNLLAKYGLLKKLMNHKRPHTLLANVGVVLLISREVLKKFTFDLILLENTRFDLWYLPYCLDHFSIKFLALPHNLESLVPTQKSLLSNELAPRWLEEEIGRLAFAERVFTISCEEAWLLSLHKIKSFYLPYWPVEEVYDHLIAVRNGRKDRNKKGVLLIGTAGNPPTYAGMKQIIEYFANHEKPEKEIYVAGYKTEIFNDQLKYSKHGSINILGQVSNQDLIELYKRIECVIINQQSSSGALTKIIEFLIAGIPVLIDQYSIRSYHNIKGLYTFYHLSQINDYLSMDLDDPPLPEYPTIEVSNFLSQLKEILLV